jgi:hypothetical protein
MEQLTDLHKFITMVIIAGVTLVIGMYIMAEIGDGVITDTSYSGIDQTAFADFSDTVSLDIISTASDATCSEALVYNATDDSLIVLTGNYSILNCVIVVTDSSPYNATSVYVNYSYAYTIEGEATAASNASDDMVTGLSNGTGWIAILIVVMFATIILGMLSTGLNKSATSELPVY